MNRTDAISKLISVRHYCFVRGVLGNRSFKREEDEKPEDDFRGAFRIVNSIYVELRDEMKPRIRIPIRANRSLRRAK